MSPDRVVVGVESERARKLMARLYKPFMIDCILVGLYNKFAFSVANIQILF